MNIWSFTVELSVEGKDGTDEHPRHVHNIVELRGKPIRTAGLARQAAE